MCKIKFAQEAGCKQAAVTRGAQEVRGLAVAEAVAVALAKWRRRDGAEAAHGWSVLWSDGRAARLVAADEERFSKWVLECKWNNDKLKRQAEVLAGRNGCHLPAVAVGGRR